MSVYDFTSPAVAHVALTDLPQILANTDALRDFEASVAAAPPANPRPGQFWWTTDTTTLYQRNQADTAWEYRWSESDPVITQADLDAHTTALATVTTVHGIQTGSGNGLDADLLDGYEATFFATATHNHGLVSGTKMAFFQSAVPTGWTQDTSQNDKALRVVSGTGGGSGGSLAVSSANTGNYTLLEADIPAHTHTITRNRGQDNGGTNVGAGSSTDISDPQTSSTGGGGAHDHPLAIAYIDVVIGTKD